MILVASVQLFLFLYLTFFAVLEIGCDSQVVPRFVFFAYIGNDVPVPICISSSFFLRGMRFEHISSATELIFFQALVQVCKDDRLMLENITKLMKNIPETQRLSFTDRLPVIYGDWEKSTLDNDQNSGTDSLENRNSSVEEETIVVQNNSNIAEPDNINDESNRDRVHR